MTIVNRLEIGDLRFEVEPSYPRDKSRACRSDAELFYFGTDESEGFYPGCFRSLNLQLTLRKLYGCPVESQGKTKADIKNYGSGKDRNYRR